MRLDGRKGDRPWWVYHAERCEMLHDIVWLDDVTNEWAKLIRPICIVNNEAGVTVHRARKIQIIHAMRLCIINPIEDAAEDSITDAVGMLGSMMRLFGWNITRAEEDFPKLALEAFSRLEAKPGDVLVLSTTQLLSAEHRKILKELIEERLKELECKVLVLDDGMKIGAIAGVPLACKSETSREIDLMKYET